MEVLSNGHDVSETKRATVPTPKVPRKAAGRSTKAAAKDSTSSETAGDESGRGKAAASEPKRLSIKRANPLDRLFPGVREDLNDARARLAPLARKIVDWQGGEAIENVNDVEEIESLVGCVLRISQTFRGHVLGEEAHRHYLALYSPILAACERVYDLAWAFADSGGSPAVATELLFKAASVVALLESAVITEHIKIPVILPS